MLVTSGSAALSCFPYISHFTELGKNKHFQSVIFFLSWGIKVVLLKLKFKLQQKYTKQPETKAWRYNITFDTVIIWEMTAFRKAIHVKMSTQEAL